MNTPKRYAQEEKSEDVFDEAALSLIEDDDLAFAVLQAEQGDTEAVSVDNIVLLTARLAQLLAEESDMLATMRLENIDDMQREKKLLTLALEKQRKIFARNPHLLDEINRTDKIRLEQIILIFEDVMRENHRRLLIAKEVNKKVIEAVANAVKEANTHDLYTKRGRSIAAIEHTISVSLDQRI